MNKEKIIKMREQLIQYLQHPSCLEQGQFNKIPFELNRENDDELRGAIHLIDYLLRCELE